MDLTDAVALVTGASRGIGRALAVALGRAGASVACAARATDANPGRFPGTVEDTARAVEGAGGRALPLPANLADDEQVRRMVRATEDHFGRVDILINNAVATFPGDLDLALRRYDVIMGVNVRAPLIAIGEARRGMRARGRGAILNVSSAAAVGCYPGLMAYAMSKAALERLTVYAAAQLREEGIAVTCFRVDVPVASEMFLATHDQVSWSGEERRDPGTWERPEVAAAGMMWLLRRPLSESGRIVGMAELLEAEPSLRTHAR